MSGILLSASCLSRALAATLLILCTGCTGSRDSASGAGSASHDAGPRANASAPNVVFVFADDLGYGDLGV
jgi:hypothetical protein